MPGLVYEDGLGASIGKAPQKRVVFVQVWRPTTVTMDSGRALGLTFSGSKVAEALRSASMQLPRAVREKSLCCANFM